MANSNKAKPYIYLPIEVKAREYKSKLLFSCIAARKGFNIVLGNRKRLQTLLNYLPKGIFIEKGLESSGKARAIRRYIMKGHKTVAWDEEGLVYIAKDVYRKNRVNIEAFELLEAFFAWGDEQKKVIVDKLKEHNLDSKIVKVTGNPRVDLLNTEFKQLFSSSCNELKKKYGPYILINSNYTIVNPFVGDQRLREQLERWGYLEAAEEREHFAEIHANISGLFKNFIEMLPVLSAAFKEHTIIVRPHPAESHTPWQQAASELDNVLVINDGSNVIPWVMASDALVHNSCTTGIEAYLLGQVAIAYCPIEAKEFMDNLPNQLSYKVYSLDDLVSALQEKIEGKSPAEKEQELMKKIVGKHIMNVNDRLSSELILDELRKISLPPKRFTMAGYLLSKYCFIGLKALKTSIKRLIGRKIGDGPDESYIKHKFQDLTVAEIEADIGKLSEIDPSFAAIKVRSLGDQCFYLAEINN